MSKAIDSDGIIIGNYDGVSVKSENGKVLFRVIDSEVFQPLEYDDRDMKNMNKGQLICVGSFSENKAITSDGDLLFKLI